MLLEAGRTTAGIVNVRCSTLYTLQNAMYHPLVCVLTVTESESHDVHLILAPGDRKRCFLAIFFIHLCVPVCTSAVHEWKNDCHAFYRKYLLRLGGDMRLFPWQYSAGDIQLQSAVSISLTYKDHAAAPWWVGRSAYAVSEHLPVCLLTSLVIHHFQVQGEI